MQETYLRAWRSFGGFEGRSSVRTWLYRIATNVCLTALERRGRRPLPSGLAGAGDPEVPLVSAPEVTWLQPVPDALLAGTGEDPARAVAARAGIRLALVAAQQYLQARQRAMLILRDVLGWPAAEVAGLLGTTTTAVNSGLRRARAQLARTLPAEDDTTEPKDRGQRAASTVSPRPSRTRTRTPWRNSCARTPCWRCRRCRVVRRTGHGPGVLRGAGPHRPGMFRLMPTAANGSGLRGLPARPDGVTGARGDGAGPRPAGITRIDIFLEPGLFGRFGLPEVAPAG